MTNQSEGEVKTSPRHYRLTVDEWVEVVTELKPAEIKILYYLRTLDPFGDRPLDIGVREMAKILSCSPGTVSKALKALDTKGYIDLEITTARVKLHSKSEVFPTGNSVSLESKVFPTGNNLVREETITFSRKQLRSLGNTQPPEPSPAKGSRSPQTIHTLKTDQTPTPDPNPVCVKKEQKEENQSNPLQENPQKNRVESAEIAPTTKESAPTKPNPTKPGNNPLPEILRRAENLGVRLGDRKLKAAIAAHPTRLETAVEALSEKAPTVRYPTRFLEKALLEAWEPETKQNLAFSQWYGEARRQDCGVLGGELLDGVQWVFDHQGDRHRWDELKALSWDELKAKLNPSTVMDFSGVLAAIDCEILRLRWAADQVRTFLEQTFETSKCSQLSDEQLLELLALLEGEVAV